MADPSRRGISLDHFRKCQIEGCELHVYVAFGPPRCAGHGGPVDVPTYTYSAFSDEPAAATLPAAVRLPSD